MRRSLLPPRDDLPGSTQARNWLAFAAALTLCVTAIAGVLIALAASANEAAPAAGKRSERAAANTREATFSMPCYWEGEACLGALAGLRSSRTLNATRGI